MHGKLPYGLHRCMHFIMFGLYPSQRIMLIHDLVVLRCLQQLMLRRMLRLMLRHLRSGVQYLLRIELQELIDLINKQTLRHIRVGIGRKS